MSESISESRGIGPPERLMPDVLAVSSEILLFNFYFDLCADFDFGFFPVFTSLDGLFDDDLL